MKTRLISAIIALAIIIPLILNGGAIFNLGVYVISILALKEFLDIKSTKKQIPIFIQLIAYIFITILIAFNSKDLSNVFTLDYRILAALFMAFLIPTVFYHERSKYSINDAFYLIGGLLFTINTSSFIRFEFVNIPIINSYGY